MICKICEEEIDQENTRAKRQYHPACKRFRNYLDAAVRASKVIIVESPAESALRNLRREVFTAGNRMGAILQKRDARGRFC